MATEQKFTNAKLALAAIEPGCSSIRVCFLPGKGKKGILSDEAKAACCYFYGLSTTGSIAFDNPMQPAILYAVITSGFYDHPSNRVFVARCTSDFDAEAFVHALRYGFKEIVVINPGATP